ncbi:HU family DNA-binding protein [Seohaeicola zhoushanensis]|uniref:DNA-binding protein n=1 Tax=Seohaeicola zhoushanensis TaxID=1569283 RepID=A0A8J3GYX0_9RHOB|nr:HU family DNA-binding protein [Seohaeicola zhoushanensis]GHF53420.1 hypothetical protein GCM10017056_26280 [Seohaeicola zhoushanensis]
MPTTKPPADSVAAKAARPRRKAKAKVDGAAPAAGADLKKAELIELVVARSGLQKKAVKPAVEAILSALGEAIEAGRPLNLPPLGRLRVARTEQKEKGSLSVLKLRRGAGVKDSGKDPLADTGE